VPVKGRYHRKDRWSCCFPMEHLEGFRASLLGLPPLTLLQRLGVEGGLPKIECADAFRGVAVH